MKYLCLAPHCDDETLGCGGALARAVQHGHHVTVAVLTGPGPGLHPVFPAATFDTVRAEAQRAMAVLGVQTLLFGELPAAMVADVPKHERNRAVHELVERVRPDVLFVPHPADLHDDHREVFAAASVAWRPVTEAGRGIQDIYAYEVLSETGWNAGGIEPSFVPNVWLDIGDHLDAKLRALACYQSQLRPFPDARSVEAVTHLARYRGAQMGLSAAEAFVLVRRRA
jgi:LmbE family N-acetylglucosaminyl deacetylase